MGLSQKRTAALMGDHRHGALAADGMVQRHHLVGEKIYVGEHGVNDVGVTDAFHFRLGASLPPESPDDWSETTFATADPTPYTGLPFVNPDAPGAVWVPFTNGWGNGDPVAEPVCFWVTADGHVYFDGWPDGGTLGLPMFTVPVAYRPERQRTLVFADHTSGAFGTGYLATNGQVVRTF